MTELSRSLLAAARDGLAPDAAIAARVRAKVAASIAAGAGATAVATTTPSTATAATAPTATASTTASAAAVTSASSAVSSTAGGSTSMIVKIGVALLVMGAITTSVLVTRDRAGDAPRLTMSSNADLDEPRGAERTVAHDDSARAGAASAGVPTSATAMRGAPSAPSGSAAASSSANGERAFSIDPSAIEIDVPRATEPVSLSREVELIDLAMASLRKHAPAAALAAIHTFDRETLGRGQMAEEAAAIAIEARCGLHQDVTELLAAFDRAWPSSAQRSRVVTTCFAK